jgi:hypothetical protein
MQVRKLDTSQRSDVRAFIRFPFELYRDCPQWVPPLISDMRFALDRERYPFYRESDADFIVAESEGQVLARVAVLENRPYNRFHQSRAAFFYYWDTVQDLAVAQALFEAAFDWARQRDLHILYGPKGMLRADGHGLLVEGFEHRPAVGVPYNLAYYDSLLCDLGFEKELDYLSAYLSADYKLPQRIHDIADRVKERRGFRIMPLKSRRELLQLAPLVHKIYQQAFVQVWGYYPVSEQEIVALIGRIKAIADPRLIKLVMKGDEAIGFMFAFPDVSAAIQRIRGRFWPFGWMHLLVEARRTDWLTFNGVGVLPKYQGSGANAVMYSELAKTFADHRFRFRHGDYVQVAETNIESLGDAAALGLQWYKRHRMYRRSL